MVFEEIGPGEKRDEAEGGVDDGQLSLLAVAEKGVGFGKSNTRGSSNEVGGHDGGERGGWVMELNVSIGNDTQ